MDKKAIALIIGCAAIVSPFFASGDGFTVPYRSITIESESGDRLYIGPGDEYLEIRLDVDGESYVLKENLPLNAVLLQDRTRLDYGISGGKYGSESGARIISIHLDPQEGDSTIKGSSVVYEYTIYPGVGYCEFRKIDEDFSTILYREYCDAGGRKKMDTIDLK